MPRFPALACAAIASLACASMPTTHPLDFGGPGAVTIPGLAACSDGASAVHRIDPDRPVVLLVHGCYSSGGRFRSLAEVFELHGQQTLCFNYDFRDSLRDSGDQLDAALRELRRHMRDPNVTILGHSQGGLVARAALSRDDEPLVGRDRLVTVSSPFAGIRAASDCGSLVLHVATLGITVAVCQIATGSNWSEIHPKADMVREPAVLRPTVSDHLAVMTRERDTCRRYGPSGTCEESDFVFALEEQDNPKLLEDPRVTLDQVAAGHVEIVGESGVRPEKLITMLQRHGVLAPTPVALQESLTRLLTRLF